MPRLGGRQRAAEEARASAVPVLSELIEQSPARGFIAKPDISRAAILEMLGSD
jgi:hypothetical protein